MKPNIDETSFGSITIGKLCKMEVRSCPGLPTGVGDRNGILKGTINILTLERRRRDIIVFHLLIEGAIRDLDRIRTTSRVITLRKKLEEVPTDQGKYHEEYHANENGGAIIAGTPSILTIAPTIGPLCTTRPRIVGVVLVHIYSLSIHQFRPAF